MDPHTATARQMRVLRRLSLLTAVALAAVVGGFLVNQQRQRPAWERERIQTQARIDGARAVSDTSAYAREGQDEVPAAAPRPPQKQAREASTRQTRPEIREDSVPIVPLRRQLPALAAALDGQRLAAALDLRAIQRANRSAVAMIYVETEEGEVSTATAFTVRTDATLLTSRHVVAGAEGRQRVRRMAIQFSDSEQVWPARLLMVSNEWDLALVKVDNIVGEVPTIRSLNLRSDTITRGSPVALIGLALGGDVSASDPPRPRTAKPLVGTGVVHAISPARIEVQGFGAAGASGSPIFDANGEVIAILFGGRRGASGQRVFGVPATAAAEFLRRLR